jgi:hypothetical protein
MLVLFVHGFHRLSSFLSGQKWNLRSVSERQAVGTYGFRTSLYSSRVLVGLRHPWPSVWRLYEASDGDRHYSSVNRGVTRLPPEDGKSLYAEIRVKLLLIRIANLL